MAPSDNQQGGPTGATGATGATGSTGAAPAPKSKVVEFTGPEVTIRRISADDLKRVGVTDEALKDFKTLEWSRETNFEQDVSSVSDEVLDVLIRQPDLRLKGDTVEA